MTTLFQKDLRLLAPYGWLIVLGHAIFALNAAVNPEIFFWMNVLLILFYVVAIGVIDWRYEADRFVASLPVDRSTVVRARFAGALGAAVVGTGLFRLYGAIYSSILPEHLGWSNVPDWGSAAGVAAFFLVVLALTLLFLPFHFLYGTAKGIWGWVISVLVLGAAASPLLASSGRVLIVGPSGVLREAIEGVVDEWGAGLGIGLLVAMVAFATGVSLWVSIEAYRRRDL